MMWGTAWSAQLGEKTPRRNAHKRDQRLPSKGTPVLGRFNATVFGLLLLVCVSVSSSFAQPALQEDLAEDEGVCPMKCACLDSFIQCTKENLETAPSRVPKWAEFLDLSGNRLRENINESIVNLPSLNDLRLKRNRLRSIPVFRGLDNLDKLTLSHNQIDRVSAEAIAALPRLSHLDLSKNQIKVLSAGSFPMRNVLKVVNMDSNVIEDIQRGALTLNEATDLKLKGNRLVSVSAEVFQRLKQLKKLQLSGNRIEIIHGLTFKHLAELRVLQLRNNRIRLLQPGAFHGMNHIEKLELDNNRLTNISKEWLFNLTSLHTLSLSNNSINAVEIDSWDFVHNLHTLELSNNQLDAIESTTLEKLLNLREFFARNNRIKSIAESAFRYVPSLQLLDLSHNQISSAIEDLNAPFSRLVELRRLDLSANRIMSINQRAFAGLKALEWLDLTGNNVTTIQNNAFSDLETLKELLIDSPTLLCDCQLQWLHDWLWELRNSDRASVLEKLNPVCRYPVWLRGKSLMDLGAKNFTCNDSPKPKIIEEPPQTLLALKGTRLNLTCTATTTSTRSVMKFQWRRDNSELKPELSRLSVLHSPTEFDNSTVVSSVLQFETVNQSHVGNYQCIVTNDYGSTYSMKHKITVGTLPTFKKIPTNMTVNAGDTIRLDCSASGEPRATLAWLKDGGNDFPAARERRMHVMPEDYAFFITNARVQDSGVYSCCAENMVGVVVRNATIVVLEVPTFLKPLEDKEVLPGTPTVLECMASGSPRPAHKWTKDGQPINGVSDRYYFAADDQLLVIMDSQARDAGIYECEIWNELGSDSGSMKLTVATPNKAAPQAQFDSWSIIIIICILCILGTSIIWLVIIYHTKKPAGRRGSPGAGDSGVPGRSPINNSTMLTVGDGGQSCACDYATSLLPNGGGGGTRTVNGISGDEETMYGQQHGGRMIQGLSPVGLNRRLTVAEKNELMALRQQIPTEEDEKSCKDSGNGDSAKERNTTSSDDEEMDDMMEMANRSHCSGVSIQRNRLNEYLGGEEEPGNVSIGQGGTVLSGVYFAGADQCRPLPVDSGLRTASGSTFRGSSGSILRGCNASDQSSLSNSSNRTKVAYVPTAT